MSPRSVFIKVIYNYLSLYVSSDSVTLNLLVRDLPKSYDYIPCVD